MTKQKNTSKNRRVTITLPEDIYNTLYEQAKAEMRTVSNQLTYILTNHFAPTPLTSPFVTSPFTLSATDHRTTLTNTTTPQHD